MRDNREECSTKFAQLFELISCAHNIRLSHVRFVKLFSNILCVAYNKHFLYYLVVKKKSEFGLMLKELLESHCRFFNKIY